MIRAIQMQPNGRFRTDVKPEEYQGIMSDPQSLLWVDFEGESPQVCEPILHEVFGFHPLAVDDALQETHVPKLDDWDDYLYVVMHNIAFTHTTGEVETYELDAFLGQNYIVTHHDFPIPAVDRVWTICQKDQRQRHLGADHVLYRLSDELMTDFMLTVEEMDDEIESVEDQVLQDPTPDVVQKIFTLKRATLYLRRSLSPLREVYNKLARDEYQMIDQRDRVYFRDVYDHLVRLHDISESMRDLVGGVLDTYLSVINNRMNEIMKTLTIITTLFMPLSFLTGFFGMNFFVPDPPLASWVSLPVFIGVLVLTVATPLGMSWWIRRRGWMGGF